MKQFKRPSSVVSAYSEIMSEYKEEISIYNDYLINIDNEISLESSTKGICFWTNGVWLCKYIPGSIILQNSYCSLPKIKDIKETVRNANKVLPKNIKLIAKNDGDVFVKIGERKPITYCAGMILYGNPVRVRF